MRKIMTDKKDPKDFDFTDSNDFDFSDPILSKDFISGDEPPIAVVPETNDFDFDFDDEPTTPIGKNVIKRQNTINEKEVEKRAMAQAFVHQIKINPDQEKHGTR